MAVDFHQHLDPPPTHSCFRFVHSYSIVKWYCTTWRETFENFDFFNVHLAESLLIQILCVELVIANNRT